MNPTPLLQSHHRWLRFRWPLSLLAVGLSLTLLALWMDHPTLARLEKWGNLAPRWSIGLGLTALAALAIFLFRRPSLSQNARQLDSRLQTKNRLEAAAVLQNTADPIALAQREETADFLSHVPTSWHPRALLGLTIFVVLLAAAHLATFLSWTRPWLPAPVAAAKPKPPAPAAILPTATIQWKTPEAETKASPVEELPLTATSESSSGLRNLTLEISVNGQPRSSTPITLAELEKKGSHAIDTSIYLDQLEVQPYDMVSYYLSAQRIYGKDLPVTTSPVQFVQIKPFRDDVREMPGGGDPGNPAFPYIKALKAAQLRLLKENFLLTHAEISHDQAPWKKQNDITGGEQVVLEKKATEVIAKLVENGTPAEIVNLISQSQPLIADAATRIQAVKNAEALIPQGKALALITEVEKFFVKVIAKGKGGKPGPKVNDPFKNKQELELKQRFQTKSGELELLAKEQARLAEDVAKNEESPAVAPDAKPDPNRIDGTLPERQTQISQRIGALLTGKIFLPVVTDHLENAQKEARESLRNLDADDTAAATSPAAAAAQKLRLALQEMNKAGEEATKDQLADAMQKLNQAADQASQAGKEKSDQAAKDAAQKAAEQTAETKAALADAAARQQETGSAAAAAKLAELANALNAKPVQEALKKLQDKPRDAANADAAAKQLHDLAEHAGQNPAGTEKPTPAQIAKLVEELQRSRANLQRLAATTPSNQGEKPSGEGKNPPGEGGKSPGEGGKPPGEGGKSPGEGEKSPGEGGKPSGEGGKSPGEGGTAPGEGGTAPGEGKGAGGGPGMSAENRERLANEVVASLREQTSTASQILPTSPELKQMGEGLASINPSNQNYAQVIIGFEKIAAPLDGLITILQREVSRNLRAFSLEGQNPQEAPPIYRASVADYFEQLSRDYPTPPPESDPDKKTP